MRAGIAASPHCAERRICRCSIYLGSRSGKPVSDPASRSWLTSSGVAFHRTAPSCEEPDQSTRLRGPKVRWSFDLSGLASGTEVPRSQNHPVFCGPSWVNHSCVPLRSPGFTRKSGSRVALEKIDSSGASSRLAPKRTRKLFPLPAGGDRTFGHLPHPLAVSGSWRGRDRRPDHPSTMHLDPESGKQKMWVDPVDNVDIGHNRGNLFAISKSAGHRLPFCSPPPTSAKCLNRLHCPPNQPISTASMRRNATPC